MRDRKSAKQLESLAEVIKHLKLQREVVPPGMFDTKAGISFSRFLSSFERYFDNKFDGTERDKSLQLGNCLQGSIKRAFDAMNGSQVKFSKLTPKLKEWYRNERSSVRQKSFSEFQGSTLLPGDSLGIYCLRLEGIALKAFPGSSDERERQLCAKFRKTAPSSFQGKLDNAQSTLSIFGERKLSWEKIKKIAEAEDRRVRQREESSVGVEYTKDQPRVWYNRPQPFDLEAPDGIDGNNFGFREPVGRGARPKTRVVTRSSFPQTTGVRSPNKRVPPVCGWCGNSWHTEVDCWRKLGLCLSCGDRKHKIADCPKKTNRPFSPLRCSRCNGPHLGRDCSDGREPSLKLNR